MAEPGGERPVPAGGGRPAAAGGGRPAAAGGERPVPPGGERSGVVADIERVQEIADYIAPLALRIACTYRVADCLIGGPRPVAEIAAEVGLHAETLRRLLRVLAMRGVFTEPAPGVFALTPLAQLLRGDHPLSLRDAYPMVAADLHAWAGLEETARTGTAAFPREHGESYYAYLAGQPAVSRRVDASVEAQNRLVVRTLIRAYDWASCGTIVDLGGGTGLFLAALLARFSRLRGILVDLPHVAAAAPRVLAARGVSDRVVVVAGDYFATIPPGEDTYLLKTVLHDWTDEHAGRLLRAVAMAMRPDSRLLVLEAILPDGDAYHVGKLLDLHSLVLTGAPDRSREQLIELLHQAGLETVSVTQTATLAVLAARRAV
ncbi:methyltransferase [Micromonospora sp. FIMYZ51]|uniref:methyltransferase n=1 Tax=Micromonospora sp. FIMYZ51 TaxID=3051832 RepID=UPI00311FCEE7